MIDAIKLYNNTTKESIIMDKFSARFLLDDEGIDWGVVTPTIESYPTIYGFGSKLSNITFQKSRTITITGWMINDNTGTIQQKQKILNQFVNPLNEITLFTVKHYIKGYFSSSVKYTNKRKENNDLVCKFQISLSCVNPFFKQIKPTTMLNLEKNYTAGTATGWTVEINNPSGFNYGLELYVKLAEQTPVNYLSVTNATTYKKLPLKIHTYPGGSILYFNTIKGEYSFGTVSTAPSDTHPKDFDVINMSDSDFEFIQLKPGKNTIRVMSGLNTDVGDSLLDVYFNPLLTGFEGM